MAIENLYPTIKPSLNLDFANTKTLDPRINFSRASTATYYDGKTFAKAEENLLLYSQDFGNAYWSKTGSAITVDQVVAPDGTNTADKLTESTTYDNHFCRREINTTANETYTISVYAKNVDGVFLNLSAYSNASSSLYAAATFNLSTGVVANTGAVGAGFSVVSSSITLVGDAWYRCVLVFKNGSASPANQLAISLSETGVIGNYGLSVYTGDGVSGIYIWGAQLEQRSQVTAYTPTTTQAITKYQPALRTAVAGAPRFDHDPLTGESLGLLIEEQRTNLLLRSQEFDNASWAKLGTGGSPAVLAAANQVVAPDGTLTADKLIAGTGAGTHYIQQSFAFVASTTYTVSMYVKAGESTVFRPGVFNGAICTFDASIGQFTSVSPGTTTTSTSVGNGWWRISMTATAGGAPPTRVEIYTADNNAGDGYRGIYIWGAQLEAGAFATSYIKTEASQATRAADNAAMTGTNFSSWYRADEGTFLANYIRSNGGSGSFSTSSGILSYIANSLNDRIILLNTGSSVQAQVRTSGVFAFSSSKTHSVAVGGDVRAVMAYKTANYALTTNADVPATGASALAAPLATEIGFGRIGNENYHNGHIRKIAYYPRCLTNTQLQALTT